MRASCTASIVLLLGSSACTREFEERTPSGYPALAPQELKQADPIGISLSLVTGAVGFDQAAARFREDRPALLRCLEPIPSGSTRAATVTVQRLLPSTPVVVEVTDLSAQSNACLTKLVATWYSAAESVLELRFKMHFHSREDVSRDE